MTGKICLVIIYNHRFEKNIQKLNAYYKDKFTHIFHVLPFYTSDDPQVITVYENSHQFSGYVAQAFQHFYDRQYSHYVFIGDDLLLNPALNEQNITERLHLDENTSYIKNIFAFHTLKKLWYAPRSLYRFVASKGVNYAAEIPGREEAFEAAKKHNIEIEPLNNNYFTGLFRSKGILLLKDWVFTLGYLAHKRFRNVRELPYPLVGSYADFFVVSQNSIENFSKYCGVFAAMNLFAEVAIPTALMLAADRIKMESAHLKGKEVWIQEDLNHFLTENNKSVRLLFKNHPEFLYFHPAKLSVWNID